MFWCGCQDTLGGEKAKGFRKNKCFLIFVLNVQQDKTEAFCDKYLVSSISPRARET